MIKRTLVLAAAIFLVACNSGPLPGSATNSVGGANVLSSVQAPRATATNSVGGANVLSSVQAPRATATTRLSLAWGKKGQAGQVAIADVMSYGGAKLTITAPDGWQKIRDDSTSMTRQSLYWHAIQPDDPSTATWTFSEQVDAQGAMVLLDNIAAASPVDVSSGKTGGGDTAYSDSVTTTADGDLILIFKAIDFSNAPLSAQTPDDMSAVVKQEGAPHQYWILATWQSQKGASEETKFSLAQGFNWVGAQVAIKHGAR